MIGPQEVVYSWNEMPGDDRRPKTDRGCNGEGTPGSDDVLEVISNINQIKPKREERGISGLPNNFLLDQRGRFNHKQESNIRPRASKASNSHPWRTTFCGG